jgi:hypothetical protein
MLELSPAKARIFRITHVGNLQWAILHGLHCRNSQTKDPGFHEIGIPDIIAKRATRSIPVHPGGTLDDYIPFYFTPCSPMLLNIKTGHNGVRRVQMEEIIILVSSLPVLRANGHAFIFTDRHAVLGYTKFHTEMEELAGLDWDGLRARDFRRDPEKPDKFERYQAEALVHKFLPFSGLTGVVCHGIEQEEKLKLMLRASGMDLPVVTRPQWYFQ